jgi:hypothetical protein
MKKGKERAQKQWNSLKIKDIEDENDLFEIENSPYDLNYNRLPTSSSISPSPSKSTSYYIPHFPSKSSISPSKVTSSPSKITSTSSKSSTSPKDISFIYPYLNNYAVREWGPGSYFDKDIMKFVVGVRAVENPEQIFDLDSLEWKRNPNYDENRDIFNILVCH